MVAMTMPIPVDRGQDWSVVGMAAVTMPNPESETLSRSQLGSLLLGSVRA